MSDEGNNFHIIDTNIYILRCLYKLPIQIGKQNRILKGKEYEKAQEVFSKLSNKIITTWIKNEFDKVLNRICLKIAKDNYILLDHIKKKVKNKWDNKISKKIKFEEVPNPNVTRTKKFYNDLINSFSNDILTRWEFFRKEKNITPEYGDCVILAEAKILKSKYDKLFIVTNDGHFTFSEFSAKIKEEFDIGIYEVEIIE